jgi:hypothetical protein
MPNIPLIQDKRLKNLKDLNKGKNTLFSIEYVNNSTDGIKSSLYFNDSSKFLATSNTGFTQSSYDFSNILFKQTDPDLYDAKAKLADSVSAFALAPLANSQIDQATKMNLLTNDSIMVIFRSNYAGATYNLSVSDTSTFALKGDYLFTGTSTADTGVTPLQYTTIAYIRASQLTLTGALDLSKIGFVSVKQVNGTATNRITPVAIYNANNYLGFINSLISLKLCCPEIESLKQNLDTAEVLCGTSVIEEEITKASFEFGFTVSEESPHLFSLISGIQPEILPEKYWKPLSGFDNGQTLNSIPSNGQLAVPANTVVKNITLDCGNLQLVDFSSLIAANTNILIGEGQYSYDSSNGIIYFNTGNAGKFPEIWSYDTANFIVNEFSPSLLGYKSRINIQILDNKGKLNIYKLKQVQFKYPDSSIEDTGFKHKFVGTVKYASKGDVRRLQQV